MLEWPDDVPCGFIDGSTEKPFRDGRLRTTPQRGRAFMRAATSANPVSVPAEIMMTLAQVARFERFWEEDTEGGILPFLIKDHVYNGAIVTDEDGEEVTDEDGDVVTGVYYWLVQFGPSAPVSRRAGIRHWRVAFQVEVL